MSNFNILVVKHIDLTIKALLLLSFSLACSYLTAQTGSVTGVITSEGTPLSFVNVGLEGTSLGTFTDTTGMFAIQNVPLGSYTVTTSLIGYDPQVRKVNLTGESPQAIIQIELTERATVLGEVVVSATMKEVDKLDSPVPVEVYSKRFFERNPTPSVFESMQNVNGVRPQLNCNVCNTGDIHINGLEGPYTMVLIDGMPIVSGLSTVYGLTGIPQSLIERVEVVKGPASTLYGSEAVGGLINVITKKPSSTPTLSADAFMTSWREINADIGIKFNNGKNAQSLLGINYFHYDHPIDHNADGFTDIPMQKRISVFNKWSFQRPKARVFSIAGRYLYEDRWGGQMNWTPEYRGGDQVYGESIYTSRWEAFGVYQLPLKEMVNFQFSANGHSQNSVYGETVYIGDQYIGFGQLTWNKLVGKRHDFLMGAAYRYTYYDDNTTATEQGDRNEPSQIHLPGLFVQDEVTFNDQNKLLLGLRYDYNSHHGNIFSPRLNYKWNTLDRNTTLRFSVGNGYRVANIFTEDHAALTGARQVEFDGELLPERSWNTNLNLVQKWYTSGQSFFSLDASVFYTYFHNRIVPDYETDPNKIIYSNLDGSAVSKGISLNLDALLSNGLNILAGVTLMDVTIDENGETRRQLLTEQVAGVWNISYPFGNSGIVIDYTGNLYGPMRLPLLGPLDQRPEYSPWWSLQNIQVSKKFSGGWEVYVGVKNLLNFTPPDNSIARAFDPFDKQVQFGPDGQVVPTSDNPQALTFDPTYVYAPNQGIRGFVGFRYIVP